MKHSENVSCISDIPDKMFIQYSLFLDKDVDVDVDAIWMLCRQAELFASAFTMDKPFLKP